MALDMYVYMKLKHSSRFLPKFLIVKETGTYYKTNNSLRSPSFISNIYGKLMSDSVNCGMCSVIRIVTLNLKMRYTNVKANEICKPAKTNMTNACRPLD